MAADQRLHGRAQQRVPGHQTQSSRLPFQRISDHLAVLYRRQAPLAPFLIPPQTAENPVSAFYDLTFAFSLAYCPRTQSCCPFGPPLPREAVCALRPPPSCARRVPAPPRPARGYRREHTSTPEARRASAGISGAVMQSAVTKSAGLGTDAGSPGGVMIPPLASLAASSRLMRRGKARVSSSSFMP